MNLSLSLLFESWFGGLNMKMKLKMIIVAILVLRLLIKIILVKKLEINQRRMLHIIMQLIIKTFTIKVVDLSSIWWGTIFIAESSVYLFCPTDLLYPHPILVTKHKNTRRYCWPKGDQWFAILRGHITSHLFISQSFLINIFEGFAGIVVCLWQKYECVRHLYLLQWLLIFCM